MVVSIHAPARGATPAYAGGEPQREVSIHAPARGATSTLCLLRPGMGCFNPRPREGGDSATDVDYLRKAVVSIHAPARGATARDRGKEHPG